MSHTIPLTLVIPFQKQWVSLTGPVPNSRQYMPSAHRLSKKAFADLLRYGSVKKQIESSQRLRPTWREDIIDKDESEMTPLAVVSTSPIAVTIGSGGDTWKASKVEILDPARRIVRIHWPATSNDEEDREDDDEEVQDEVEEEVEENAEEEVEEDNEQTDDNEARSRTEDSVERQEPDDMQPENREDQIEEDHVELQVPESPAVGSKTNEDLKVEVEHLRRLLQKAEEKIHIQNHQVEAFKEFRLQSAAQVIDCQMETLAWKEAYEKLKEQVSNASQSMATTQATLAQAASVGPIHQPRPSAGARANAVAPYTRSTRTGNRQDPITID